MPRDIFLVHVGAKHIVIYRFRERPAESGNFYLARGGARESASRTQRLDADHASAWVYAGERCVRQGLLEVFSVTPIQSNPVPAPELPFHSRSCHETRIRLSGTVWVGNDWLGRIERKKISVVAIERSPAVYEQSNGTDYLKPGQQLLRYCQALDVLVEA